MKVFLTGGSGDLGQVLCRSLQGMGNTPVVFDLQSPPTEAAPANPALGVPTIEFIEGSILDREKLNSALPGSDVLVHIAAWHGIHEFKKEKNAYEFFDLNVTGTFNVFQAAIENGIKDIVFISSTSIGDRFGIYGNSKILGEELATAYAKRHGMNVIILRPRAFIPPWNKAVYGDYISWAKWFWKGAVHISDVAQAVIKSIDLLCAKTEPFLVSPLVFTVDGKYEYTDEDLAAWDKDGPGSTFKKYYGQFYDLAVKAGLDPTLAPEKLDISETARVLNYKPLYSLKTLLLELRTYGPAGPYAG